MNMATFKGIGQGQDSAESPAALRFAEGLILRPSGGFARSPSLLRMFDLFRLSDYAGGLALTAADRACLFKIECQGAVALAVVDIPNQLGLGFYWVKGGEGLTLTEQNATVEVLWRRLQPRAKWFFSGRANQVLMGNGIDPNLIYEVDADRIRQVAGQVRPLLPSVSAAAPIEAAGVDASLVAHGIRWEALEPRFDPTVEFPYQRAAGNYVRVSVGYHGENRFLSSLTGRGTAGDPYHYRVAAPMGSTNAELVSFVIRDPNAAGVVVASEKTPGAIVPFSSGQLRGGQTQFESRDVFTGPDVEVALTYYRRGRARTGFETMPSGIVTVRSVGGQRIAVTVHKDTHPAAAQYDSIRIYVGENKIATEPDRYEATPNGTFIVNKGKTTAESAFSAKGYRGLRFALEVPNADGTYTIVPSMIGGRELSIKNRVPPPARAFVFAYTREWYAGDTNNPLTLTYSQTADSDQRLPEGVAPENVIHLPTTDSSDRATAIIDAWGYVVAFTTRNAYRIGTDFSVASGSLNAGPLNQDCIVGWGDHRQLFLGSDFGIYEVALPDSNDQASNAPISNLIVPGSSEYISRFADPLRADLYACSAPDYRNQMWYFWVRGKCGKMLGFCVDVRSRQLTGPFTNGGFISARPLPDGRIGGIDLAGNLRWFRPVPTTALNDTFDNTAPLTLTNGTQVPGRLIDGEAIARIKIGTTGYYLRQANVITLQTGWITQQNAQRLTALEAEFHVWKGSAGIAVVTVTNERGQTVRRYYGEVAGKTYHRQSLLLSGDAFQATLQILCGDGKPCAVRAFNLKINPNGKT
jgi:hypothetical protein